MVTTAKSFEPRWRWPVAGDGECAESPEIGVPAGNQRGTWSGGYSGHMRAEIGLEQAVQGAVGSLFFPAYRDGAGRARSGGGERKRETKYPQRSVDSLQRRRVELRSVGERRRLSCHFLRASVPILGPRPTMTPLTNLAAWYRHADQELLRGEVLWMLRWLRRPSGVFWMLAYAGLLLAKGYVTDRGHPDLQLSIPLNLFAGFLLFGLWIHIFRRRTLGPPAAQRRASDAGGGPACGPGRREICDPAL